MVRSVIDKNKVWIMFFAILLAHVPFLNQAFHIDDAYFFQVAKQILHDPFHPLSFKINWDGSERMAFDFSGSPPLFEYYLALIMKYLGESELILHCSMIIFSIITAISMYFLSKRFTKHPISCTLLLLFTPAYLVMAHTIMLDVPSLALFLAGIACFIYAFDKQNMIMLAISAAILGLASLIKYNSLLFLPILVVYSLVMKRKLDWRIFFLFISIFIFSIYSYYTSVEYGKAHFSQAATFIFLGINSYKMLLYSIALSSYVGGATIFPFSLILVSLLSSKKYRSFYLVLILSIAIGALSKYKLGFSLISASALTIFTFAFFSFLNVSFEQVTQKKSLQNKWLLENIFLILWIIFVIAFHTLVAFVAVRFILNLIPPLIILFYRLIEDRLSVKLSSLVSAITIFLTCALGLLVSWADLSYANSYRSFANNSTRLLKNDGHKVWYAGHWGFQFYMDKQGYSQLENFSLLPKKGDIIFIAFRPEPEFIHLDLTKRLRIVKDIVCDSAFPIRTMNEESNAGFYTSSTRMGFTFLPFSFSQNKLEEFLICEVNS